eukprot:1222322-Amphidinium_carterae.1
MRVGYSPRKASGMQYCYEEQRINSKVKRWSNKTWKKRKGSTDYPLDKKHCRSGGEIFAFQSIKSAPNMNFLEIKHDRYWNIASLQLQQYFPTSFTETFIRCKLSIQQEIWNGSDL